MISFCIHNNWSLRFSKNVFWIFKKAVDKCEIIMRNPAKKLLEITCDNPDDIFVDDDHTMITKVAVTVDGTWQRCGHCSKIGVVFVISVITGEVINYVVKSLVCRECIYHQNDNKESEHKNYAFHLTKRSAVQIMQVPPMLWKKKVLKRQGLMYVNFIGDGDIRCFAYN